LGEPLGNGKIEAIGLRYSTMELWIWNKGGEVGLKGYWGLKWGLIGMNLAKGIPNGFMQVLPKSIPERGVKGAWGF